MRTLPLLLVSSLALSAAEPPWVWNGQGTEDLPLVGLVVPAGGSAILDVQVTGVGPGIRLAVELPTVDGPRRTVTRLTSDGWHRIHLPLRALEPAAAAVGGNVRVQAVGEVPPGLRLTWAGPWATPQAAGPGMTEAALLDHLDWSRPSLAPVRDRLLANDPEGAKHLLAAAIRQRPVRWSFPPVRDRAALLQQAERILAGDVRWIGLQRTFPDGRIDWLANHSLGTPQETPEWVWTLNRHADLQALAQAYQETRDERFATAWVRLTGDWIRQAPPPSVPDERPGSAWRTLDSGLRMTGAWCTGLYAVLNSPALTDEALLLILRSLWDHGEHLARAPYNPSNHVVFGMSGLYTVAAQFPEFREASAWRAHAGRTLERLLVEGTLADGAWYELSPGYGQWICDHLVGLWNSSALAEADAELGPGFRQRLRALAEWGVQVMAPDRTAPMLNDGVRLVHRSATVERLSARFPESPLLRWLADDLAGRPTEAPAPCSRHLAASGHLVLRTDWSRTGTFLLLDGAALGGWHGHQDALNLVAWFHGREFLFDNGGYKYDASRWRAWAPTTAAHNTVLVDGLGQARNWDEAGDPLGRNPDDQPPTAFGTSPAVDWATAWYVSGYAPAVPDRGHGRNRATGHPASHRRDVVLVKDAAQGPVTVVLDTLVPDDAREHRYEVRWHLKSQHWRADGPGRTTWTADPGQPNLVVASLAGATGFQADSGVRDPEPLGWWIEHQNADPTPALTLRHQAAITGTCRILTALIPFREEPTAESPVTITPSGTAGWTIHRPGRPDLHLRLTTPTDDRPALAIDGIDLPAPARP